LQDAAGKREKERAGNDSVGRDGGNSQVLILDM
jgi:hypothetical protein